VNQCLIPYPESEQARRMLVKVCVRQHGEALLDALCQDAAQHIEQQVKNWLEVHVLPTLQGKISKQAAEETESATQSEAEALFAPQSLYSKPERLPLSELRANLISLFINEFGASKTKMEDGPQKLLSRKLEDALAKLCQHWQNNEEDEAFKVLSQVIGQYFYAANADNSDQPKNQAKVEQAVRALEKCALNEPDDHQRRRLLNRYQDAWQLTEALWAYFAQHGGLKDVNTQEKLLEYVLQLPRFHHIEENEENFELLARYIPELHQPNYNDIFLCYSRLPHEERQALEAKLGVVIAADGIRPSAVKFINPNALRAHYKLSAETLRQRFNSAARHLAHCLWGETQEANDA